MRERPDESLGRRHCPYIDHHGDLLWEDKQDFLSINYDDFLRKETQREKIMKYFELSPSDDQRKTANDWLIK